MLLKKIYWLALFSIACNSNETPVKPVVKPDPDEPKQYGTPFSGVSDPQKVVLYEVNIRAFSPAGDLQGVIDKLDHIKSLGINTIWLMPIHPVGKEKSAGGLGSPYAVQNYLEVNTEFGNLAKLRELVQGAHDRSMAVIIDWVANHTAWDNPWMENKSWYAQDANGNVIIPPGTNWQDVAELNYNNTDMRKAMIHAMKYWVLEANIDGFRCDAVDYVPSDFWKQALDELKAIKDRKLILLAEGGKQENFSAGFQMNYAWDFCNALEQIYQDNKPASLIFTTHTSEYSKIPAGAVKLRYTTNHDLSAWEATPIEVFGSEEAALSASVITLFTSAAPLLYSSQEVGREEKLPFFTREPIEWNSNADMLAAYQKIFSIYNSSSVFVNGDLQVFDNINVAAFKRFNETDQYLVFVNVRNSLQELVLDVSLQNTAWKNKVTGETIMLQETLTLPPYAYLVLGK
jgi:glycosidase